MGGEYPYPAFSLLLPLYACKLWEVQVEIDRIRKIDLLSRVENDDAIVIKVPALL